MTRPIARLLRPWPCGEGIRSAQRIRRLRNAAGLSQDALAREAGIGRVTLVRLEKGEQTPRHKTLSAIARALEVGVSELLVESEFLRQ